MGSEPPWQVLIYLLYKTEDPEIIWDKPFELSLPMFLKVQVGLLERLLCFRKVDQRVDFVGEKPGHIHFG